MTKDAKSKPPPNMETMKSHHIQSQVPLNDDSLDSLLKRVEDYIDDPDADAEPSWKVDASLDTMS